MTCFETSPSTTRGTALNCFRELVAAVEQADSAPQLLQTTRALANALESHRREGTAEPPPNEAFTCLVRILGYNNPGAAVAAVDGLIASGPDAVSALLAGLDDRNYGARAWAVRALAGIGDVRGLDLLEQALADDIGPSVRRAAAIGMGTLKLDPLDPAWRRVVEERALQALQTARHDAEWVVRYAVAAALEKLARGLQPLDQGHCGALEALASLADIAIEEVPVVRLRARLALTRLTTP
ncbi:MAG: HEAT repeat domain-containing protein [Cyanobacteriota bacterium]|nr:HEAT repeat domain-containing protein [Cyanobacteriota bacterium]